ncbi:DUF5615 family PIN-like protein [Pseudanabaena sp. UWO310]|uniref:DUF5615 family PIN-like protein n=1 Tax=Pseudanabaena sp. UWO310 TaxID=2480795 RepID=UPI001158EBBB|nr:DUF5615 family PIN-like protein [Pseudanabaena sp. UWO310]TYQ27317.1 hypothetical protein PseudUWO310_16015 [Pseudanabaena sp. UWO310]
MKFLADENFDNTIIRGLLRRKPDVDLVHVRDVGLAGADDPTVLEWAAQENRVLLTHDVATVTHYAYERMAAGQSMTGVIEVTFDASIGRVIEDLLFILDCSLEGELEGQIYYLPL